MYQSVRNIINAFVRKELKSWNDSRVIVFEFTLNPNYDWEDGYRECQIAFYKPNNYIQCYMRFTWEVCPLDERSPYVEGRTPWFLVADHDSCWNEAADTFIVDFKNLATIRCPWGEFFTETTIDVLEDNGIVKGKNYNDLIEEYNKSKESLKDKFLPLSPKEE